MDIDEMINRLRRKAQKYDREHDRVGGANWGEGAYYAGEKVFMDKVSLTLESQAAQLKAQQARIEELERGLQKVINHESAVDDSHNDSGPCTFVVEEVFNIARQALKETPNG